MRTIWKFTLRPLDPSVHMPGGAKVLTAREQGDDAICVWVDVDPSTDKVERRFAVYGTGHDLPDDPGTYVGTAVLGDGALVFHVYDLGEATQ